MFEDYGSYGGYDYGYYGGLGVAVIIFFVIFALIYVSMIGARYVSVATLFAKAGESPWKSLIPVYDMYIFFKLTWNTKMFIPYVCSLAGYIVGCIVTTITGMQYDNYYMGIGGMATGIIIMIVCGIAGFVFSILLYVKIAKAYGKSGGFAVGLIFLNLIFMMILAFGQAKYRDDNSEDKFVEVQEYKYAPIGEPARPVPSEAGSTEERNNGES